MTTMLKGVPMADANGGAVMTVNSVRLAPSLEARLAETAGRLHMSKSDVIRQALVEFLGRHEALAFAQAMEELGRQHDQDQGQPGWDGARQPLASVA